MSNYSSLFNQSFVDVDSLTTNTIISDSLILTAVSDQLQLGNTIISDTSSTSRVGTIPPGTSNFEFVTTASGSQIINGDNIWTGINTFTSISGVHLNLLTPLSGSTVAIKGYTQGVIHSDSSGTLTSSQVVDSDISGQISYSKLNLSGQVKSSDINSQTAASGHVLTANGSGLASWAAVPSGGGASGGNLQDAYNNCSGLAQITTSSLGAVRIKNGEDVATTTPLFIGVNYSNSISYILRENGDVLSNGTVTAVGFAGSLSGNANTATLATTATNANNINLTNTTSGIYYLPIVAASSGNQTLYDTSGITINASGSVLSATTFIGTLSGNATGATTATNANNINLTNTTSGTYYLPIVAASNGNQTLYDTSGITINASGSVLSATTFIGTLSGTANNATNVNITTYPYNTVEIANRLPFYTNSGDGPNALKSSSLLYYVEKAGTISPVTPEINRLYTPSINCSGNLISNGDILVTNGNVTLSNGSIQLNGNIETTAGTFYGPLSGNATSATSSTTATLNDDTTAIATTAFIQRALENLLTIPIKIATIGGFLNNTNTTSSASRLFTSFSEHPRTLAATTAAPYIIYFNSDDYAATIGTYTPKLRLTSVINTNGSSLSGINITPSFRPITSSGSVSNAIAYTVGTVVLSTTLSGPAANTRSILTATTSGLGGLSGMYCFSVFNTAAFPTNTNCSISVNLDVIYS